VRSRPGAPSARSREYHIIEGRSGLITVVGGKYTTYRAMAEKITDVVMRRLGRWRRCRTRDWLLDGTPRGPWQDFRRAAVARLSASLPEETARHLVNRYGRRADDVARYALADRALAAPVVAGELDIRAELSYQRDHEMAVRREDSLLRRTRLGLFHPELLVSG
jgi:glycerol-3-phosphate dehydrogenase